VEELLDRLDFRQCVLRMPNLRLPHTGVRDLMSGCLNNGIDIFGGELIFWGAEHDGVCLRTWNSTLQT
jgi:hypothetical protein